MSKLSKKLVKREPKTVREKNPPHKLSTKDKTWESREESNIQIGCFQKWSGSPTSGWWNIIARPDSLNSIPEIYVTKSEGDLTTLPETNSKFAPENWQGPKKETIVFQPSIFRCYSINMEQWRVAERQSPSHHMVPPFQRDITAFWRNLSLVAGWQAIGFQTPHPFSQRIDITKTKTPPPSIYI